LEVWNPGILPGTLTLEDLRHDHPSVPNNPLIAESLYLAGYIEKAGSGTQKMIELCGEAGLPAPDFEQRQGSFVLTIWRDWLTTEALSQLQLNERQILALTFLKSNRRISNPEYQRLASTTKKTATRDLGDLREKGVIEQRGERGPGVHYVLASKRDRKGTMGT
jgi:predicted HTH transcriptional regulator